MKTINKNKLGEIGLFGENAAVDYLSNLGYEIIARNVIYNSHEIDMIVRDMRYIVFVEVKTRTSAKFGLPRESVTPFKQNKIRSVATCYLKENMLLNSPVRFDVIDILEGNVTHIPNAF